MGAVPERAEEKDCPINRKKTNKISWGPGRAGDHRNNRAIDTQRMDRTFRIKQIKQWVQENKSNNASTS